MKRPSEYRSVLGFDSVDRARLIGKTTVMSPNNAKLCLDAPLFGWTQFSWETNVAGCRAHRALPSMLGFLEQGAVGI